MLCEILFRMNTQHLRFLPFLPLEIVDVVAFGWRKSLLIEEEQSPFLSSTRLTGVNWVLFFMEHTNYHTMHYQFCAARLLLYVI